MAVADFSFWRLFSLKYSAFLNSPRGQAPHPLIRKTWYSNQCVVIPWERFVLPFCFTQGHRILIQWALTSDSQALLHKGPGGRKCSRHNQLTYRWILWGLSSSVISPEGFPRPLCLKWSLFVPNLSLPQSTVPIPTWHLPFSLLSVFFTGLYVLCLVV